MSEQRRNISHRRRRRAKAERKANAKNLADFYNSTEVGSKQGNAKVTGQSVFISLNVDVKIVEQDIQIFAHNAYVNCVERMKHLDKVIGKYQFKFQELEIESTGQGGNVLADLRLQMAEIRAQLCGRWFQFQELFRRVYQHDPIDDGRDNICADLA